MRVFSSFRDRGHIDTRSLLSLLRFLIHILLPSRLYLLSYLNRPRPFVARVRSLALLVFRVIFSVSPINSVLFITRHTPTGRPKREKYAPEKDGDGVCKIRSWSAFESLCLSFVLYFCDFWTRLSPRRRCNVASSFFFNRNPIYCKHKMCFSIDTNYKLRSAILCLYTFSFFFFYVCVYVRFSLSLSPACFSWSNAVC